MTEDLQEGHQTEIPSNIEPKDEYSILAEKVRTYGSTPGTSGHIFEDDYAIACDYDIKLKLATALIRSDWYEHPSYLLSAFCPPSKPITATIEAKRNILRLELLKSGKVTIEDDQASQRNLEGGVEAFIQDNALLQELANSLPIGVMGAVTNVLLFSNITDEQKREELRAFTTRSLLRPYLGDIMVRKPTGDVNFRELVELLPDQVFEDSQSSSYEIIKNFFVKQALTWFTNSEEEGFKKLEEFYTSLPHGIKRTFYENVWQDFQETKDYKVPDCFVKTIPGFNADITVDFPAFRQKHFAKDFIRKRRDYLNVKTGAGKTSSSYLAMESVGCQSVAIFGPSRARSTWKKEASKIFTQDNGQKPEVFLVEKGEDLTHPEAITSKYIYISSDLFPYAKGPGSKLYDKISEVLKARGTDGIIVDEAHTFQNPNTDRARTLKLLTREAEADYASTNPFELPMLHLSATPISDDLNDLDVSMSLLYPNKFAYPGNGGDGKVPFKQHVLNNPRLAYSLLLGENLMSQWGLNEMFGNEIPRLEYDTIKLQLTAEQRVLYEWLSNLSGTVESLDGTELIRLQKDILINPRLIDKSIKKGAYYPFEQIPPQKELEGKMLEFYKQWQEWDTEKEVDIPDMKFGANWIALYADPNFILQCFFSPDLIDSVDGLIRSNPDINKELCEFHTSDSPKFSLLKKRLVEDLAEGKKVFIVSPHRKEGITDSFRDIELLKEDEIDEDSILKSLFTHIDFEWMKDFPPEARVSIDATRMKTFGQRDEAARKWRESGSENRVVVATMESVYESMDWSLKKTDDNHDITGAEVYFLSWPWGWDDFEQQCGRFIRPGMAKPVNIHVLEGVDTVDQGIADNVKRKQLLQELTLSGVELSPEDQEFFSNAYGGRALIKTEHTSGQLFKRDVLSKLSNTTEEEIIRQLSKIVDGKSGFERFADAFFDEGKDMFRASAFSTEIAKNIILEKGPERILSLGAGTCIFARKVKEDDYPGEVDNLDINPAGLSLAKYNFPEAVGVVLQGGISDLTTVKPVNLDYDQTPFSLESSHYDAVECSFTLNWTNNRQVDESGFPIDAQDIQRVKALSEINRVLKPGGSAVITLPKTALDSSHFEAITKSLEENFGFEIVSNRSGKARATDIGKDVGWIITAVKVDRTDLDNLEPDSLNLLTDSPYVLSHYNDRKNGNVSINMDSQALYSPQDFVVTNPLTNESYDAKNQIQKAYQELPRFEKLSIQEMKYALEKGSIQWRAWHEMRRIIQRSLGYKYHQAERAIGDVIDKEGLATPHLWDNETINHNKALILDEVLNLQPATV